MSEGEKLREAQHPGKSADAVRAGFNNFFSTQSKNSKNPRIQGWDVSGTDAQGRVASVNRWLPFGVHPKDVQLWETTSVPLTRGNCDQTTTRNAQHNDTIEVVPQDTIADTCNQDNTTSPIAGSAITGDISAPTNEPATTAYDAWSEGAQGNFWGLQVKLKRDNLRELRVVNRRLEELSSRSTQLKESQDKDMTRLKHLEDEVKDLREKISQRAMKTDDIDREVSSTLEVANGLDGKIRDLDEEFAKYFAEEDD